jgi:hypothetical protein
LYGRSSQYRDQDCDAEQWQGQDERTRREGYE